MMCPMERNDDDLIADYLEGDEGALEELVDRHLPDVRRFALSLVRDEDAADDVAQEAFVRTWKGARGFRGGANFRSWLFGIARNAAIDWLRAKRHVALSQFEDEGGENTLLAASVDDGLSPELLLAKAEDEEYITALLGELDAAYRQVLELRYWRELTFAKMAAMLKRPLHTVKSQHRRALAALRRVAKPSV